jgi:hypothetical protein
MERDLKMMYELVKLVEAFGVPQSQLHHQIRRMEHTFIQRPVLEQRKLESLPNRDSSFVPFEFVRVEPSCVLPVELSDGVKYIFGDLLLKEHARSPYNGIPQILVVLLL